MPLEFPIGRALPWRIPPLGLPLLLFIPFAALIIHVCQRLVERTSIMIEPEERKDAFARTSLCVGSLIWTLDVVGLFLFEALQPQSARLAPVGGSLLLMIFAARWTTPSLSNTQSRLRIVLASLGLAGGFLVSHLLLMTALGEWSGRLHWAFLGASMLLMTVILSGLSMWHRSVQLRAIRGDFRTVPWAVKLAAGALTLPLQVFLVNTFPITLDASRGPGNGLSVLIVLVLLGTAYSADQMFKLRVDEKRQQTTNRALSMIRRVRPDMEGHSDYLLALVAERLPTLLAPGALQLNFQPICPTHCWTEGIRFEALLRVHDRDLGRVHPELLFLACERAGKSHWVDRLILERALDCSALWTAPRGRCVGITVNVAPDTLLEDSFVPWLQEVLGRKCWPQGWLQLEITEHALIANDARLACALRRLRAMGVQVSMDDFGAGFSSLTALADLPIQGIKCDRAFVKDLAEDSARQGLLRHVCEMGKGLGLSVTIEGVETEEEWDIVRSRGGDYVQGFIVARPMAPDRVEAWLASRCPADPTALPADTYCTT